MTWYSLTAKTWQKKFTGWLFTLVCRRSVAFSFVRHCGKMRCGMRRSWQTYSECGIRNANRSDIVNASGVFSQLVLARADWLYLALMWNSCEYTWSSSHDFPLTFPLRFVSQLVQVYIVGIISLRGAIVNSYFNTSEVFFGNGCKVFTKWWHLPEILHTVCCIWWWRGDWSAFQLRYSH